MRPQPTNRRPVKLIAIDYDFLDYGLNPRQHDISDELRQLVQDSAMEDHDPYFDTHLDFKHIFMYGGSRSSIVCENSFADEVINLE